ncbi:vestigial like family member 1 S homeolog [Xenopus laevis]|uniref:Vestigial like family member 1 S homeolog n=1 Tax=Xenopus laevis TaxID=8355 RepID=E0XKS6_XENLA|nr:vestigial like family member 1 S homeolog [Xenopus laevis]ADK66924.1 vestigial-like 1 [Xenopus laevis]
MEDLHKSSSEYKTKETPVKTELGSRCVVFTYYQGDINSVVDEHFSRALRTIKDPQDLSIKHRGDDYLSKNMSSMATDDMNWTRPYQATPPVRMPASALTPLPSTSEHYATVFQTHPHQAADIWPLYQIGPHNPIAPVYQHSMSDFPMVPGTGPDGKPGSLLSLLQHERYPAPLQESIIKQEILASTSAGMSAPENLNPRMNPQADLHSQDRRKDYFHPQDRRKDLYFY